MDYCNCIRVSSLRLSSPCRAKFNEFIIRVDRQNKILGNPYPMKDESEEERTRVIELYKVLLEKDLEVKGPMYQALRIIAYQLINSKKNIALACWCKPKACHADLLIPVVLEMVGEILKIKEERNGN